VAPSEESPRLLTGLEGSSFGLEEADGCGLVGRLNAGVAGTDGLGGTTGAGRVANAAAAAAETGGPDLLAGEGRAPPLPPDPVGDGAERGGEAWSAESEWVVAGADAGERERARCCLLRAVAGLTAVGSRRGGEDEADADEAIESERAS
jgi:hypothetical protein